MENPVGLSISRWGGAGFQFASSLASQLEKATSQQKTISLIALLARDQVTQDGLRWMSRVFLGDGLNVAAFVVAYLA